MVRTITALVICSSVGCSSFPIPRNFNKAGEKTALFYLGGGVSKVAIAPDRNTSYRNLDDSDQYEQENLGSSFYMGIPKVSQDKKVARGMEGHVTIVEFKTKSSSGKYQLLHRSIGYAYDRFLFGDFSRGLFAHIALGGTKIDIDQDQIPDAALVNHKYGAYLSIGLGLSTGFPILDTFQFYYTRSYFGSAVSTDSAMASLIIYFDSEWPKRVR